MWWEQQSPMVFVSWRTFFLPHFDVILVPRPFSLESWGGPGNKDEFDVILGSLRLSIVNFSTVFCLREMENSCIVYSPPPPKGDPPPVGDFLVVPSLPLLRSDRRWNHEDNHSCQLLQLSSELEPVKKDILSKNYAILLDLREREEG